MAQSVEKAIKELLNVLYKCSNHQLNEDAYTAPEFIQLLNRPLTILDIPMQSSKSAEKRPLRKDLTQIPWEDSIKNFVFDLTSVNTKQKFDILILLVEPGYKFLEATSDIVCNKYLSSIGAVLEVIPSDEQCSSFNVAFKDSAKTRYSWVIDRNYLVNEMSNWSTNANTIIFCHTNSIPEYRHTLKMLPNSVWSVSCSLSYFVESSDPDNKCNYVCPVYSCDGSIESRAVGKGSVNFIRDKVPSDYEGRLNYYLKCIRGSKHSSGRCYDCQMLYNSIISTYRSPEPSPIKPILPKFSPTFLSSIDSQ